MTTRIPQIPSVSASNFLPQLRELVLIREGKAPNALEERFITFADLIDPDFINSLADYEFPITGAHHSYHRTGDRIPPNPPTSFAVADAFFQNNLTWVNPPDEDLYYIEIYMASVADGAASPSVAEANHIGVVTQDTTPVLKFEHIDIDVTKDYYYWIRAVDFSGNRSTWATNSKVSASRDIKHYYDGSNYYVDYMLDSGDIIYRMGSGNNETLRIHQNGEINIHGYNSAYGYGDTNSIFTVGESRELKAGVTESGGISYLYSDLWDFRIGCVSGASEWTFIKMLTNGELQLGYAAAGYTHIDMMTETLFQNEQTVFHGKVADDDLVAYRTDLSFGSDLSDPSKARITVLEDRAYPGYVGHMILKTYAFWDDETNDKTLTDRIKIDGSTGKTHFYAPVGIDADNEPLMIGVGFDTLLYHDGTDTILQHDTGDFVVKVGSSDTRTPDDTFTGSDDDPPDSDKWGRWTNSEEEISIQSNKLRFPYMGLTSGLNQWLMAKWVFDKGTAFEFYFDFDVYQDNSDYASFAIVLYDEGDPGAYKYLELYRYWGDTDRFYFGSEYGTHNNAYDYTAYDTKYTKMKFVATLDGADLKLQPYLYDGDTSSWTSLDSDADVTWNTEGNIRMYITNNGIYSTSRIGVDIDNFTVSTGTVTWDIPYVLGGTEALAIDSSGDIEAKNDLTVTGDLYAHTKVAKTSGCTLSAGELNGFHIITNDGAAGEINLALPAGADNYQCHFIVTDAQYLKVTANGTEKFRYQGTEGAAGGYVRSNVVGTVFSITWSGDNWVIHGLEGELKYDE